MIAAAQECEEKFLKNQIGKIHSVLFETSEYGYSKGFTPNYTPVHIWGENIESGTILNVKIVKAEADYCIGEID